MAMTAKSKPRKARRAIESPYKSTSVRFLVTPAQLTTWQRAANISHEGNLSMFLRAAADDRAAIVIEKADAS